MSVSPFDNLSKGSTNQPILSIKKLVILDGCLKSGVGFAFAYP